MAVYKRGGTYCIDYFFEGRRIREAVGPLKKEAEAKLGGILRDIREGRHFPDAKKIPPTLFSELADIYESHAKEKKGWRTEKYFVAVLRDHFGARLISTITRLDVEQFKMARKDTPRKGKVAKPRTGTAVNHELRTLRAMLNKAVHWELLEKSPAARVTLFPEPSGRNFFLSVEEAGRLLAACHSHLRPVVLCALETGMRKTEILGLKWSDIRNGMIYLPGDRTKNGKPREIPVSKRLAEELKRLRRRQSESVVVVASDVVFRAHHGRPSPDGTRKLMEMATGITSLEGAWRAAKERAGIAPGFHFHDLRHTFASHQKMAGVDDFTLMELLGHSDFTMMKRYAHLTPEHKRRAVEMLPEWGDSKSTRHKCGTRGQGQEKRATGETP